MICWYIYGFIIEVNELLVLKKSSTILIQTSLGI